jgi:hypothetical protein
MPTTLPSWSFTGYIINFDRKSDVYVGTKTITVSHLLVATPSHLYDDEHYVINNTYGYA